MPVRDIAEAIGRGLKVLVLSKSPEEAAAHFGWLRMFVGRDLTGSSVQTQRRLGWRPTGPGLIADLDPAHYFAETDSVGTFAPNRVRATSGCRQCRTRRRGLPAGWLLSVGLGDLADELSPGHIHGPVHLAGLWPRIVLEDFHHQGRVVRDNNARL